MTSNRVWVSATLLLTIGTATSAILAAVTLETLMQRPSGGGSMTTMMPGAVYASATVMKVCVVWGVLSAVVTVAAWISGRLRREMSAQAFAPKRPIWGLTSTALVVFTPWIGAIGAVIAQGFVGGSGLSLADLPTISHVSVFVQYAALAIAAFSAGVSLAKREQPRLAALLSLVASVVLIALFWHFQFHVAGLRPGHMGSALTQLRPSSDLVQTEFKPPTGIKNEILSARGGLNQV